MAVLDLPSRAQRVGANRLAPHAALFACLVMWSLNAVVLKVGLTHVRPLPFTTVRFLIAGAILLAAGSLVKRTVLRPPRARLLLPAALLGMFLNQVAFSEGLHLTTAVDTSLIMGVSPILTAVVLVLWTRAEVSRGQWLALGLGFLGTLAVVAQTGAHAGQGSLLGDLIVVGAPSSWALYMVLVYVKAQGQPMPPLTAYSMLAGAAMMLPAAVLLAGPGRDDWAGAALPLAYTSVVATALPWTLYFWALPRIGVTATSIYTYLQPPLGACFGALFLHEAIGWGQLAGAALILVAAYLGSWRYAPKPLPRAEAT